MDIDTRFSQAAFVAKGKADLRTLCEDLSQAVQERLHQVLIAEFEQVVSELNAMGHSLRPYGPIRPGDVSYRDDEGEADAYVCRLRLAADTTISTGYADTVDYDKEFWSQYQ